MANFFTTRIHTVHSIENSCSCIVKERSWNQLTSSAPSCRHDRQDQMFRGRNSESFRWLKPSAVGKGRAFELCSYFVIFFPRFSVKNFLGITAHILMFCDLFVLSLCKIDVCILSPLPNRNVKKAWILNLNSKSEFAIFCVSAVHTYLMSLSCLIIFSIVFPNALVKSATFDLHDFSKIFIVFSFVGFYVFRFYVFSGGSV